MQSSQLRGGSYKKRSPYNSDPQKRWAILKLLDDSCLTSALTDYNYEANSNQIL
jgi:hypothetical protein